MTAATIWISDQRIRFNALAKAGAFFFFVTMSNRAETTANLIIVGGIAIIGIAVIGLGIWALPQIGVYNRTLAGKAALMEAESTRQVRVLEAKAKKDSASLEAEAEVERAKGVAEANKIIGDSLKDNPRYLQYLYITGLQEGSEKGNRTIYVPTEGGLPVPTLGIEK